MFGFHVRDERANTSGLINEIGKNSEQFTIGDAVYTNAGFADVAGATQRLLGFANEGKTFASDNETVAQDTLEMVPAYEGFKFECDMSAAITQADVGKYATLTGATGAQQLDQTSLSTTVGQFRIAELDPRGESSTTRVLAEVTFRASTTAAAS